MAWIEQQRRSDGGLTARGLAARRRSQHEAVWDTLGAGSDAQNLARADIGWICLRDLQDDRPAGHGCTRRPPCQVRSQVVGDTAMASIEISRPRGNRTLAGADRAGAGSGMYRA